MRLPGKRFLPGWGHRGLAPKGAATVSPLGAPVRNVRPSGPGLRLQAPLWHTAQVPRNCLRATSSTSSRWCRLPTSCSCTTPSSPSMPTQKCHPRRSTMGLVGSSATRLPFMAPSPGLGAWPRPSTPWVQSSPVSCSLPRVCGPKGPGSPRALDQVKTAAVPLQRASEERRGGGGQATCSWSGPGNTFPGGEALSPWHNDRG